jgi:hypothetical protein
MTFGSPFTIGSSNSFVSPFTGNVIQPTDVSYRDFTIAVNTQLEWPINGNATENVTARIMEVTASPGGLELRMPPANQTSVGTDALIRNLGANSFTVTDYEGANTIITIAAGETKYIYVTENDDAEGTWANIAFGTGSSSADAATLAGYGLLAITTTLNQAHPITTFSAGTTADATFRAQTYVWTGGAGTLALTAAATLGNNWFMLIRNNGTGNLAIDPNGAELINGSASIDLAPTDSCVLCCSGTAFFTVGLGRTSQFNFSQLTKAVTSGAVTLTSAEAANVIQKYTGTLSGNVTVQIPQVIQVYYITNQTDGTGAGYEITFTTGVAGAANATVPAGQQVILLCDSVDIYNASTVAAGASTLSLVSGIAGAPSLNFASETSTGVYRPGAGEFGVTILGNQRLNVTALGIDVTGAGVFSGGITGGVFP